MTEVPSWAPEWVKMREAKEKKKGEIMSKLGVIGMGVGKKELVVFVDKDKPAPYIPSKLEGYPVKVVKTEKFKFL